MTDLSILIILIITKSILIVRKIKKILGAAFFDAGSEISITFNIGEQASVMWVELYPISEALSYIQTINFDKFVICLNPHSVLQYVALCMSNIRETPPPLTYFILKSIIELQAKSKVNLIT